MSSTAPLDDPSCEPANPPINGRVPDVIAKWGPVSQQRWFRRFQDQLKPAPYDEWERFYCSSEQHRGSCCDSCAQDISAGYQDWDAGRCCCKATRGGDDG
jgi:hypothetical protein